MSPFALYILSELPAGPRASRISATFFSATTHMLGCFNPLSFRSLFNRNIASKNILRCLLSLSIQTRTTYHTGLRIPDIQQLEYLKGAGVNSTVAFQDAICIYSLSLPLQASLHWDLLLHPPNLSDIDTVTSKCQLQIPTPKLREGAL